MPVVEQDHSGTICDRSLHPFGAVLRHPDRRERRDQQRLVTGQIGGMPGHIDPQGAIG